MQQVPLIDPVDIENQRFDNSVNAGYPECEEQVRKIVKLFIAGAIGFPMFFGGLSMADGPHKGERSYMIAANIFIYLPLMAILLCFIRVVFKDCKEY
jgi:hypothetical protein